LLFELGRRGYRVARRIVVAVIGGTILLVGIVMIVTPGPAMVVIPMGLAILAVEFAWARNWLHRIRERMPDSLNHVLRSGGKKTGPARPGED
jgi:tellurite resistance protein TerC